MVLRIAIFLTCGWSAACLEANAVMCGDSLCPSNMECATVRAYPPQTTSTFYCIAPDQRIACDGIADFASCGDGMRCYDGICLPGGCGNGMQDSDEVCDDSNNIAGDGCSADCASVEVCGNEIVDGSRNEQCDSGDFTRDHDGCAADCSLEAPRWSSEPARAPARIASPVTYDTGRHLAVRFGGRTLDASPVTLADTLEWDGRAWRTLAPDLAPPRRSGHIFVYDAALSATVLFGGRTGGFDNDTWTWDGVRWTEVVATTIPPARVDAAAAYDPIHRRIVMYGGRVDLSNEGASFDDVWSFDGDWHLLASHGTPGPRNSAAMAFDPSRGTIVMYGGETGYDETLDTRAYTDELWELAGDQWTKLSPATPIVRAGAAMAFDPMRGHLIVTGGDVACASACSMDTLEWTGTTWATLDSPFNAATSIADHGMTTTDAGPIVVGTAADTWLLGNDFQVVDGATRSTLFPRIGAAGATDHLHHRFVMTNGFAPNESFDTDTAESWMFDGEWHQIENPPETDRGWGAMAYDETARVFVVFGGEHRSPQVALGATAIFDGTHWTRDLRPEPSPRSHTVMTFDAGRGEIVLFGGAPLAPPFTLGDTWTWTQATGWIEQHPPTSPPGRADGCMAYDRLRHRVVMFGGIGGGVFNETWTWDGTTWTQAMPATSPIPRNGCAMAWDEARSALVLVGGSSGNATLDDVLEWDGTTWHHVANDPSGHGFYRVLVPDLDGAGVMAFGGADDNGVFADTSVAHLRWESPVAPREACGTVDGDGDGLAGCADPDCWWVCNPTCARGATDPDGHTCDPTGPRCGDGVCDPQREACSTCAADCPCAYCGNGVCDPLETMSSCPGDCHP